MTPTTPAPTDVLEAVEALGLPGTPVTTPEVADGFDCTQRTIYNRLDSLVNDGVLQTKKVGANSRVWWRPIGDREQPTTAAVSDTALGLQTDRQLPSPGSESEMAERIRGLDWSETPLGPMAEWPTELRVAVDIMLGAREAIGIYWGEELTLLYNDAWRELIADKHPEALGRPAREVFPEIWETIEPMFAEVLDGEGAAIGREQLFPLERNDQIEDAWFDYSFNPIPVGDGTIGGVFKIAVEVSERKRAQEELQRQARLNDFRVELTDELRSRTDTATIQQTALRMVGDELDATLTYYYEYDAEAGSGVVDHDYRRDGGPSVTGQYTLEEFPQAHQLVSEGGPVVVTDTTSEPGFADADRESFEALDIRAWLVVPLIKRGELVATLAVGHSTPREWTDTEVEIVEETAERTWATVERARAEQTRRESEERYRTLFESINEGFCIIDVLFDEDGNQEDYRFLETNPAFEEITGLTDVEGELRRDLEPGYQSKWFWLYGEVARTGESKRFEASGHPLVDGWYDVRVFPYGEPESGTVALLINDITERKQLERELRTEKEQLDVAVETSPLVLFRLDTDLRYTWIKNATEDFGGEEVLGKRDDELLAPEAAETLMAPKQTVLETGDSVREEVTYELPSGEVTYDLTVAPIEDESGEITGLTCAALDITNRKRAEEQLRESEAALERLNTVTQELIDAGTATIADRVAPLVRDVLGVEYTALWRYDDRSGELEQHAVDVAPDATIEAAELRTETSDQVWTTFVGTDIDVQNDLDTGADVTSPLRSRVVVPLGRHGVVCLGSTGAETFDERTVDLVETVAATVETAWDRAAGEAELSRRNEELTHLDRLNTLIREIDQALVAADTRDGIDNAVCERLAASDLYEFAWIGDLNPRTNEVEPRAWAGVDSGYLEELTVVVGETPTDRDPVARAVHTGELQVVADVATDSGFAPWREATLERGARSLVCIPLVYDDAAYGVLVVYADRPQSDGDERNQDVLSELGTMIAHTINAMETRATLRTDSVVELTLRFEDAATPLCRLARETGSTIDYQGFVPRSNGQVDVFFVARESSPEELRATASTLLAVDDLDCLTDGNSGALFRTRVSDPPLAARVTDDGAIVRSIVIDAGVATAVLDVPHTAAVREFLDRLRRWSPEFELRARQSRERQLKTRQTFVAALEDQLTDRQREVLQTAYLSGFFETPRVSNGQEVTELLGVSQPTFSEHLRAAERSLCEVLFGTESSR